MRRFLFACVLILMVIPAWAAAPPQNDAPDSDHDGLSDATEEALLQQFAPRFMVSGDDCSLLPARFTPLAKDPAAEADDGTIYGRAAPAGRSASTAGRADQVELHFYHLWRTDCGQRGHALDAEHVSALVERDGQDEWRARYWYAAAHEDTVCDASQVARASTLKAESHGPKVWISRGKHASFLSETLCTHGCGGDRCEAMKPLEIAELVNVGELPAPMNGAVWIGSPAWPLAEKLGRSDFPAMRMARLERLPETDIAWANPEKRPMQAVILGGNDAVGGGATGFRATNTALVIADAHTSNALGNAAANTGHALAKSYRNVRHALGGDKPKASQTAVEAGAPTPADGKNQ